MELTGRTVLVTGGAYRLGREITLVLAAAGCDVVIHYNQSEAGAEETAGLVRGLGRRAVTVSADLSDWSAVERMTEQVEREVPDGISSLVNSASVYPRMPLGGIVESDWDGVLNANLRGPFQLARWAGLQMKKRGEGVIVNITDCAVERVYPNFTPYLVSKGGLEILTRILAHELAPQVRVVAVAPGTVLLPDGSSEEEARAAEKRALLGRVGSPSDIARAVVHVIRDADYMTGTTLRVDGGAAIR